MSDWAKGWVMCIVFSAAVYAVISVVAYVALHFGGAF